MLISNPVITFEVGGSIGIVTFPLYGKEGRNSYPKTIGDSSACQLGVTVVEGNQ